MPKLASEVARDRAERAARALAAEERVPQHTAYAVITTGLSSRSQSHQ